MFLVTTSKREDVAWRKGSVMEFGRSSGANCLTGILMPFEKLGGLQEAKESKYIKEILVHQK